MSGLLRRFTRRRPATADETGSPTPESSEPAGAPAETPAEPGGGHPMARRDDQATQVLPGTGDQPAVTGSDQPTTVAPAPAAHGEQPAAPTRDLPAGIDPNELAGAPLPSARRGQLRRRLRYLRRVRDLLLRDLGGFAYEVERTAGGTADPTHRRLLEGKTNRIAELDTEMRALESRLGEPHGQALLREPGIGGTCPECGELHASDAHYCARCGAPLDAKARARRDAAVAAAAHQTTASHATAEPTSASVLWAAGPRPVRATEPEPNEEQEPHPSPITSQWLALSHHGPANDEPEVASEVAGEPAPEVAAPDPDAPHDEPASDASPATPDEPPRDVTAAPPDDDVAAQSDAPSPGEPASEGDAPGRAKRRRARAKKPEPEFDAAPNGRRDEDVAPPVSPGDPLGSRPEQGS